MIAYEELHRALTRWKTRRAGVVEGEGAAPPEGDKTPGPRAVAAVEAEYDTPDSTGELELTDAEVTEA